MNFFWIFLLTTLCCIIKSVENVRRKNVTIISVAKTKPISPEKLNELSQQGSNTNNNENPNTEYNSRYFDIKSHTFVSPFIFNGSKATVGQFPHVLGLKAKTRSERWSCTAFLISSTCILTAAHCCSSASQSTNYTIYAGYIDLAASENGCRQIRETKTSYRHPNYDENEILNDICIIKVSPPFNMSTSCVKSACVATDSSIPIKNIYIGTNQTGVGFGITGDRSTDRSNTLLWYAEPLRVRNNSYCTQFYEITMPATQICVTGFPPSNMSTCSGDSGGPIGHKNHDGKHCTIGLTSYGTQKCAKGSPTGYTFLPRYYESFIKKYCTPDCLCK